MAQIRVEKVSSFTQISNCTIQDQTLSYKARGLLCYMLSLPKDWDYSIAGLAAKSAKDGASSVRSGIEELINAKYIRRQQSRDDKGNFDGYEYVVYEIPQIFDDVQETDPSCGFPTTDFPSTDFASSENRTQQILNSTNKYKTNIYAQTCVQDIETALAGIVVHDDSRSVVSEVAYALEQSGYICQRGVPVPARGPDNKYRGRINIVATRDGKTIALSLDRQSIREKSIFMLRDFPCDCRIVLLRGKDAPQPPAGIDAVIPLQVASGESTFLQFWDAYPRKVDKQNALKVWKKISPDEKLCQVIMQALEHQKRSAQWTRDGGAYIPYPSTWLNGRRWEDEPDEMPVSGAAAYNEEGYDGI